MCGIFAHFYRKLGKKTFELADADILFRRGPDYQQSLDISISDVWCISLFSTVLHMRGGLCPQPLVSKHGTLQNVLLWNGEIFGGIEVGEDENDGQILLTALDSCQTEEDLLQVFCKMQGPYAFVYYQQSNHLVWFGRDIFGRRSMAFSLNADNDEFVLSSVTHHQNVGEWEELNAAGIYRMELKGENRSITCYPWQHNSMEPNKSLNAHNSQNFHLCLLDFAPLNMITPELNGSQEELGTPISSSLTAAQVRLESQANSLIEKLEKAVYRRVGRHSYFCDSCQENENCSKAHVAVMFSGGIDSVMLAYLAHRCVPLSHTIDLLNVAFEVGSASNYEVPDRITGRQALAELPTNRIWNFVEINVPVVELQACRNRRITHLIRPLDSVLDDSIGCALWFASRGEGVITNHGECTAKYCSQARVVLSGLGADEQLGGYSRHRTRFERNGFEGLLDELDMDVKRLSARNLGRDDRIISDHGKEARFPYLDEEFVSFLNGLPVHEKMDLSMPRGIGEKLLLRVCAIKCDLPLTAQLAKRAIQFGSRIAKCENRKEKGSDSCQRLKLTTS